MTITRRAFTLGLLAAPAVVRAGSLDYVPRGRLLVPELIGFDLSSGVDWSCVVHTFINATGIIEMRHIELRDFYAPNA